MFWCAIARPAFRAQTALALQAQLDRRLIGLLGTALLVSLITGIGWLIVVASQMSSVPIAGVIPQGIAGIVLAQTRFGQVWVLRGACIVVLALCLLAQRSKGKDAARWIGLVISAAFVASLAWAGHGAAADDLPYDFLHLPADLLHLLATAAWLGGLAPLGVLLSSIGRHSGSEELAVAGRASTRFSALAIACVATLLVTGIVNTWFLSGSVPALVGTTYGQLLLLKIAFFAVIIAIGNVNRTRLVPAATQPQVARLTRNALTESTLGILVLAIVGIIGTLPPGLHTEPRWPFPFRFDLAEVAAGAQQILEAAAILFVLSVAAATIAAEKRRRPGMLVSIAAVVVFGALVAFTARPGIVRAYPTTYFASTQPYSAASVAHGAPMYFANCTACHGVDGRGDGPIAKSLAIPPADLTEAHIFAHKAGDLYWWISHGRDNGVMPAFERTLTPAQRWDIINFVLARAAAVQTAQVAGQISASAAPPLPDFAFEQRGTQNTLRQTLKGGPVLLALFGEPVPASRLKELAGLPLHVLAVDLGKGGAGAPLAVSVSEDVRSTLALFRSPDDGGETELMLDRNGSVRARWTAGKNGLADSGTLLADSVKVAKIPPAAANHAGHGG